MQNYMNKILQILKDHVSQNNREIQYNQDEINRLLTDRMSDMDKDELDYKNSLNRELLEENDDFIKMQIQINEFMEKYSHLFPETEMDAELGEELDGRMPYFAKTISGQMKYGPDHPQYQNTEFFDELLRYYQEKEDYEMCNELIRVQKRIK